METRVREKKYSSLGPIIFWGKFSLFFILLNLNHSVFAKQNLQLKIGEELSIFSDKAFRDTRKNVLKATGNVVLVHKKDTLYGELASFEFDPGIIKVEGNVKFINPEYRLFGHSLNYDINSGRLEVRNGKIMSEGFTVIGDKLTRIDKNVFIGENAEYTTCKDCPESWSFFGKKVRIEIGEYIQISHALLKINGVTLAYVPYVILPIKRKRQTGLLFPQLSFSSNNGTSYMQPWFWAINDHTDLTLSPFFYSKRGKGGEFQLRKTFGERKWAKFNGIYIKDKIFRLDREDLSKKQGHYTRYFMDYSQGFIFNDVLNHGAFYNMGRDLDMATDFQSFVQPYLAGSEFGGGGYFDIRLPRFNISSEYYHMKNQIVPDKQKFDDDYVQIAPRVRLEMVPQNIVRTKLPGLNLISLGLNSEFTLFKQNKFKEGTFYRNAQRMTVAPFLKWNLLSLGPLYLDTRLDYNYQFYRFHRRPDTPTFRKRSLVYQTELSLELEKVFGLAYQSKIPLEHLKDPPHKAGNEQNLSNEVIGTLPQIEESLTQNFVEVQKRAYKHMAEVKFIHYHSPEDLAFGDSSFKSQIADANGLFDYKDALKTESHRISNSSTSLTEMPRNNTIELQWLNTLVKKSAKSSSLGKDGEFLTHGFDYSRLFYFDISQGLQLDVDSPEFKEKLTRLKFTMGYNLEGISLALSEHYFYVPDGHIFNISIGRSWENVSFNTSFNYDNRSNPNQRFVSSQLLWEFSEILTAKAFYDYDFVEGTPSNSSYILQYSPRNNCWKVDLQYTQSEIDKKVAVNFYLNFGNNKFSSLTGFSNEF